MSRPGRAGVLSVRALNQYRRRDVLTYLGLRYYLANTAAQSDEWAWRVGGNLVLTRPRESYLPVPHFKEMHRGEVTHRAIALPAPNEALAEAALLDRCARHPIFANPPEVFSYALCSGDDRTGMFQHYMKGLRARHMAVTDACEGSPNGVVRYLDIRQFYPSVSVTLATRAWTRFATEADLGERERSVGERLIAAHGTMSGKASAMLTGPMFSHFLANLVLRDLDVVVGRTLPARYFRYVDDVILVGSPDGVRVSADIIRSRLADMGFAMHDDDSPKTLEVPAPAWLVGKNDFVESPTGRLWQELVGDLKRTLLLKPERRADLQGAFISEGYRFPVRDYSLVVTEVDYLTRFASWASGGWLRRRAITSTASLVERARKLRMMCEADLSLCLDGAASARGFDRKRLVPKLRYHAARLVYLSSDETTRTFSARLSEVPELRFHSVVMAAVATGNIDDALSLGTNAAQAAAQPLKAISRSATVTLAQLGHVETSALAVMTMNGVTVSSPLPQHEVTPLLEFARRGGTPSLMRSAEPFIRELACLHGIAPQPRHAAVMDSAYDEDESQVLDAVEMAQGSGS